MFVRKKYIKCNTWRVAARPSYMQDARFLEVNRKVLNTRHTEGLRQGIRPLVFGQLEFMLEHTLPAVISFFFSVPPGK